MERGRNGGWNELRKRETERKEWREEDGRRKESEEARKGEAIEWRSKRREDLRN